MYVSDRRGDADFDGEYDMEDIYSNSPGNTGGLDLGEDVNHDGLLQAKYIQPNSDACTAGFGFDCEATKYGEEWVPDFASVVRRQILSTRCTAHERNYHSGHLRFDNAGKHQGLYIRLQNGVYVQGTTTLQA